MARDARAPRIVPAGRPPRAPAATPDDAEARIARSTICGRLERLGLRGATRRPIAAGLAVGLAAWVPLLLLASIAGAAFEAAAGAPFLSSAGTHARFLVAVPLLVGAELAIGPQILRAVRSLIDGHLVPDASLPHLHAAAGRTVRGLESPAVDAALLGACAVFTAGSAMLDPAGGVSSWRTDGAGGLSPAGWWQAAVALPIFQFVLLRWTWRLVLWVGLLWRMARLPLRLLPAHPDLAGGLGYLAAVQGTFATMTFAASAVIAAGRGEQVAFGTPRVDALQILAAGVALANLAILVGPLFLFTPRLIAAKQAAIREYGTLAARYARDFDDKWIRGGAGGEAILGAADIQSLADMAGSFDVVRQMRLAPFGLPLVLTVLAAALTPMLALLAATLPFEELVADLVHLLVGG